MSKFSKINWKKMLAFLLFIYKMSFWVEKAGHNDLSWIAGDRYQQTLLSFQELIKTR
jgi:hypothetical protein